MVSQVSVMACDVHVQFFLVFPNTDTQVPVRSSLIHQTPNITLATSMRLKSVGFLDKDALGRFRFQLSMTRVLRDH